jgi:hypothetical protein
MRISILAIALLVSAGTSVAGDVEIVFRGDFRPSDIDTGAGDKWLCLLGDDDGTHLFDLRPCQIDVREYEDSKATTTKSAICL